MALYVHLELLLRLGSPRYNIQRYNVELPRGFSIATWGVER